GAVGDLAKAVKAGDSGKVDSLTSKVAFDLVTSDNTAVARDKVGLLRASLATIDDPAQQKAVIAQVRAKLVNETNKQWPMNAGRPPPLSVEEFDKAATWSSRVSVQKTPLPPEVAGNNKLFPNKPIPGWEATTRAATKASLDDLQAHGQLFLDKIPPGAGTANVAVKLDLNLGVDGPPSVSDPAATEATLSELLERAKAKGKSIRLTVGDS